MSKLALGCLLLSISGSAVVACSRGASDETTDVDVSALTDRELAVSALQILGAKSESLPAPPSGNLGVCSGCHSINPVSLNKWKTKRDSTIAYLKARHTQDEKINYFRNDPDDVRTPFKPEVAGILCAGAHLGLGANVKADKHPETLAQGKLLEKVFQGKDALYREFRARMLMPVGPDYPRLSPTEFETLLTWFKKGMPNLAELLPDGERPTTCQDDFAGLRAHVTRVASKNWTAVNKARRVPMVGCAAPTADQDPTECFKQKRNGKDVFPNSTGAAFSRTWAKEGTVRVLRELTDPNSFWLRSSADGRFVATGGGPSGAQAIDLAAALEGRTRDIGINAEYDPDFFPDNKGFMFQGGAQQCSQSVLEKASTRTISFAEPECGSLDGHDGQLYQTVGQTIGDNSLGDRFVLYGNQHANDPGSMVGRDTEATAGADSTIQIFASVAVGNDADEGYKTLDQDPPRIPIPFRGDTMMARSGSILGSRMSGENGKPLGYTIDTLNKVRAGNKYTYTTEPLGRVCMEGNKANFSFDERFLATHHYNAVDGLVGGDPEDPDADVDVGFGANASADIVIADFVTGEKKVVTKMGPGQFALFPHFRSDGWLYFLVVDKKTNKYYVAASDWAPRQVNATPR